MSGTVHAWLGGELALLDLPADLVQPVGATISLPNPAFGEAIRNGARRLPPERISFVRRGHDGYYAPRHAYHQVRAVLREHCYRLACEDGRSLAEAVEFPTPLVPPTPVQTSAIAAADHDGIIVGKAGSGKTNIGLLAIARRGQPALWITHTRELARQTIERARTVLGLEGTAVGLYGDGSRRMGSHLTVTLVQTLATLDPAALYELGSAHGMLVVDECHHLPALQFAGVLRSLTCRHLLGLTATPIRRDGLGQLMHWLLGPTLITLDAASLADRLITPRVIRVATGCRPDGDDWTAMIGALVADEGRNARITRAMGLALAHGRRPIALTARVEHAERLADALTTAGQAVCVLHGRLGKRARQAAIAGLADGTYGGVVATGALVGEGFDCPALDTLILATPLSWSGTLTQYVGRVARTAPGKGDAVVYDLVDHHPMAESSWRKRLMTYKRLFCAVE